MKVENKLCCKWCEYCLNTNIKEGKGTCYLVDIGEQLENTDTNHCDFFIYDDDLERT